MSKPNKIHRATQQRNCNVIIKWLAQGAFISGGLAHPRVAGDEDETDPTKAAKLEVVGLVKILGPAEDVFKTRTLGKGSVIVTEISEKKPKRTRRSRKKHGDLVSRRFA